MRIEQIIRYVQEALVLTVPIFVIWGITRIYRNIRNSHKIKWRTETAIWCLMFYLICLYMITVYRQGFDLRYLLTLPHDIRTINWIPMEELTKLWEYGYIWSFTYNVVGNIVWFIPLGFLLPIIDREYKWRKVAWAALKVSFSIECLQFICQTGITDVDDLLFNTIGAVFGYMLYKFIFKPTKRGIAK